MMNKLILALDVDRGDVALALVQELRSLIGIFKIGSQLFTREGPALVKQLRAQGVEVFLDLKWHDIPRTVAHAVQAAVDLEVRFVTVHASGGTEMLLAAQMATKNSRTEILAVTVLTSLDDQALTEIGYDHTASGQVAHFARMAQNAGLAGLICSPLELELLRKQLKSPLKLITPGVRSAGDATQDQKRTLSAREALQRGADYLVIGRPITQAPDPVAATKQILEECGLL